MPYTLQEYHFNPIKSGQILKRLRLEAGYSIASAAKLSGVSYDIIDNIERGRNQDIKFEVLFKLLCVYRTSIEAYTLLMLTDDDIGFRDQVMLYLPKEDNMIAADTLDSPPGVVPDTVVAVAEAVAAAESPTDSVRTSAENPDHIAYLHQHIDHLTRLLELAITQKG